MPDEEIKVDEQEETTYYEEIRADVETAVYVYSTLEEIDTALHGKSLQKAIKDAKENCIVIMCKGLELLKEGYEAD